MRRRCVLVRPGEKAEGTTGVTYAAGVSASTTGARGLCLELATLRPGARGRAHLHAEHESAAYVLEGEIEPWFGDNLGDKLVVRPGDFLYIPGGVPHVPANASAIALPALDALPHLRKRASG